MLRGKHVIVRPIQQDDLAILGQWDHDQAFIGEFNNFGLRGYGSHTPAFAEHGLLTDRSGTLVVTTLERELVGRVDYHLTGYGPNEGSKAYRIGIALAPPHQGKGYGVEAQQLLCAYLFATFPIMRVEAVTDSTNRPEQRALEKAGFTREGVLRKAQWRNGAWHDQIIYSKLRGE